jgi:hypothetical protein
MPNPFGWAYFGQEYAGTTSQAHTKSLSDSAAPTDALAKSVVLSLGDSVSPSDALAVGDALVLADAVTLGDTVSPDIVQDYTETFDESVAVDDSVVLRIATPSGPPSVGGWVSGPTRIIRLERHRLHFNEPVSVADDLSTDTRLADTQREEELILALV